jgi:hypothetical protein
MGKRPTMSSRKLCLLAFSLLSNKAVAAFVPSHYPSCRSLQNRLVRHVHNEATVDDADSGCPFSKAFPRYRINLTTIRSEKQGNAFKVPLVSDWIRQWEKNKERLADPLDRKDLTSVRSEKQSNTFTVPLVSDLSRQWEKNKLKAANPGIHMEWLEGQDGLEAMASLWRNAAKVMQSTNEESVLLAFPDASVKVVRQWVDILEWMDTQQLQGESTGIQAVYDDSSLPTVRLSRKGPVALSQSPEKLENPSVIETRMQSWVQRILVDLRICPFTKSTKMSGQGLADLGVPVARIAYHTSYAQTTQICSLMADTWEAIGDMIAAGPSGKQGVSSILLAAPAFDNDFDLWAGPVFAMLEAGVMAASLEKTVGVVCFHNNYATPDGSSWPGFGHMHSVPRLEQWLSVHDPTADLTTEEVAAGGAWQRRTPHATINVLRADQLEAAEGRRATGILYSDNIRTLVGKPDGIGSKRLQEDLDRERCIGLM